MVGKRRGTSRKPGAEKKNVAGVREIKLRRGESVMLNGVEVFPPPGQQKVTIHAVIPHGSRPVFVRHELQS